MNADALTLALRLLTAACAGGALATMTGCPFLFDCPDPWSAVEALESSTEAELLALTVGGDYDEFVGVGVGSAGGIIVYFEQGESAVEARVSNPVAQTLRGVSAGERTIVVGDGGTILSSDDRGQTWVPRTAPVGDDLLDVARATYVSAVLVAITHDQILVSVDDGDTWELVEAPTEEGWGPLRRVFSTDAAIWVVGAEGTVWTALDPTAAWVRETLDTSATFIGGGLVSGTDADSFSSSLVLASADELWLRTTEAEASWIRLDATLEGSVVSYGRGYALTDGGVVYDIDENGRTVEVARVDFDARTVTSTWSGFVVAGDGGQVARAMEQLCIGGRPWIIDGQLTVAALEGEIPALDDEPFRASLVQSWVQDGLYEQASVASFARVAAELMSLGAPQTLIQATLAAQRDEMAHAEACFDLASDLAGVPLRAGSLPLSANFGSVSHSRTGRPAAIALAMLEEGCINESLAAAEAAVAAAGCVEPRTRAVLEDVARDEARHAALAWRSLRWLLATHPTEVEPALRSALPRLRPPCPSPSPIDEQPEAFAAHGRLSSPERALIQRRVIAEMIAPLVTSMLSGVEARGVA